MKLQFWFLTEKMIEKKLTPKMHETNREEFQKFFKTNKKSILIVLVFIEQSNQFWTWESQTGWIQRKPRTLQTWIDYIKNIESWLLTLTKRKLDNF